MNKTASRPDIRKQKSNEAFFTFLAALHQLGLKQISADAEVLHESFAEALKELKRDETLSDYFEGYHRSPVSDRFEEFDKAMIRAQQYGLIQFPNPSYTRVRISLSPTDAEQLMDSFGEQRETFIDAAKEFKRTYLEESW